jgi:outer membrane biosynthesis protein TonB
VRIALTISAVAHAMMWVPLVLPGPDPLVPAAETAIVAEIVSPDDVPETQKAETQGAPAPETTSAAAEQPPSPPPKREAQAPDRTPGSKPNLQSKPQKVASATPATPQATHPEPTPETQSTQAPPAPPQTWGSWLDSAMSSPLAAKASGMDPAEQGANIPQKDIDQFKARLKECWKPPASLAEAGNLMVVLRVSLKPSGALAAEPSLIAASGSEAGPVLMRAAMQALHDCQPYAFLPAKKYKEWKLLDLAFSPGGMTGLPRI